MDDRDENNFLARGRSDLGVSANIDPPEGLAPDAFGRALEVLNEWEFWGETDDTAALIIKLYLALRPQPGTRLKP